MICVSAMVNEEWLLEAMAPPLYCTEKLVKRQLLIFKEPYLEPPLELLVFRHPPLVVKPGPVKLEFVKLYSVLAVALSRKFFPV